MNRNYAWLVLAIVVAAGVYCYFNSENLDSNDYVVLGASIAAVLYSAFQTLEMSRANELTRRANKASKKANKIARQANVSAKTANDIATAAIKETAQAARRQAIIDNALNTFDILRPAIEQLRMENHREGLRELIERQPRLAVMLPENLSRHVDEVARLGMKMRQHMTAMENVDSAPTERVNRATDQLPIIHDRLNELLNEVDRDFREFLHDDIPPTL